MGLLDDAIREHLDLKRRRGADPAEIERAQQEALGPVRREPLGSDDAAEMTAGRAPADIVLPPPGGPSEPGTGESQQRPDEAYDSDPAESEPLGGPADWDDDDDAIEAAGDLTGGSEPGSAPAVDLEREADWEKDPDVPLGDTVSYDIETRADDEPEEDVLQETPEFLQDTPEHDRLWFEQRPPRDFDFDE